MVYINLPFRQQSSQLLYHLLHMTGDQLVVRYHKAFKAILLHIKSNWIPEYTKYKHIDNAQGMYFEVQNHKDFISFDADDEGKLNRHNTGIFLTDQFTRKLQDKCEEFIPLCDDMNYQGEGRFKHQ